MVSFSGKVEVRLRDYRVKREGLIARVHRPLLGRHRSRSCDWAEMDKGFLAKPKVTIAVQLAKDLFDH